MTESYEDKLLKKADKGEKNAQYDLARHYEIGFRLGFDFDDVNGMDADVYWYQKAAEQGHDEAQYFLAMHYYRGLGVKQNSEIARYWFSKAAEQGNVRAQRKLNSFKDKMSKEELKNTIKNKY